MIEYIPQRDNEYQGLVQFVLNGIEFRPINFKEDFEPGAFTDDIELESGSIRDAVAFSPALNTDVLVTEMHAVAFRKSTNTSLSTHTLAVEYDKIPIVDEVCLDTGDIAWDEAIEESKYSTRERIIKALGAIADERFGLSILEI